MSRSRPPWRLVTVDIDGTLTRTPGWQEIADALGQRRRYDRDQARFRSGAVDPDTDLFRTFDLATGHRVREIERILARTPKLGGIAVGVARLQRLGVRVASCR